MLEQICYKHSLYLIVTGHNDFFALKVDVAVLKAALCHPILEVHVPCCVVQYLWELD